ncbi:hypothetical protein KI688_004326 [Linnemannia hyalina]|uniref:Uncharacterized protein n=1 Tax=Linnemannia hyalina TaxID=64524 RepID=A0A9P8BPR7_9FUNG|nr:hypothetical protein KI688_004326 [Linnemannia hyalina]
MAKNRSRHRNSNDAKPLLRTKQKQSCKVFKSSPSSIIQHRQRKLLQYRPQQQLATGTTNRRGAVVPSGSSSGLRKRVYSPARAALKATVAPLITVPPHAEKSPERPPQRRPVASPSNLTFISSGSGEEEELPPHVQPQRKQVVNTIELSATTQYQKHNVLPPRRLHPTGTPKQNDADSKGSSSDSTEDSSSDSSSGLGKGIHTPTSSVLETTLAQMMTVIHTQDQEPFGPSPHLQHQSSTTITNHIINLSDSEKDDNLSIQPTQTAAITGWPIVFVPESDDESHTSTQLSLPRRGSDPVQLTCIKSSLVDKHPHPPRLSRPRLPRPRPLRLRDSSTRVNVAPVVETSRMDIQDEILASTAEESDDEYDPIQHIPPMISGLKSLRRRRKIPMLEKCTQAVLHFNHSSGTRPIACTPNTPDMPNNTASTSNTSNTSNKPVSRPAPSMNSEPSGHSRMCRADGLPYVKDLSTIRPPVIKSECHISEAPLVVPLAVALLRDTASGIMAPKMETPTETLATRTSSIETWSAGAPVVNTPVKAKVEIEPAAVDTVMETDVTELSTMEFASNGASAMEAPIIEIHAVVPVPAEPTVLKAYPLRERTFQQRRPYTADKRLHARLNLGRGVSVQPSGQSPRKKHADFAELQEDENDGDYEDGQEDPDDTYFGLEDSVTGELFPSTRPSVGPTPDADLVGAISKNLSSMNLDEEDGLSVPRRRLYRGRDGSAVGAKGYTIEPEADQEEGDGGGAETQVVVEKKNISVARYHVLPMSFYEKNKLPDDLSMLKATYRGESSLSSARKAIDTDQEILQPAHHAKRWIVSDGQDEKRLDNVLARLAQENRQREADSDRSDLDRNDNDSDGANTRSGSGPGSSRSPSPQQGSNGGFGRRGIGFGYGFSEDEAIEAEVRTVSNQRQRASKKSSSSKKITRQPTTDQKSEKRRAETYVDPYRVVSERRRAGGGGNSTLMEKQPSKRRSPYTYADSHELNKDRLAAFLGRSSTSMSALSKRKATDDAVLRLQRVLDPDAARDFMFNSRLRNMRNSTNRRAHILNHLSGLQYSHSVKRLRMWEGQESEAESDSTLHDHQHASYSTAQHKAFPEGPIYDSNNSLSSVENARIFGVGTRRQKHRGGVDGQSQQLVGTRVTNATAEPRQVTSTKSISASSSSPQLPGVWANAANLMEYGLPGYSTWDAERTRIRQERENAVPQPPQYITRPMYTLPPPPPAPALPVRSRPLQEPAASTSARETFLFVGSNNQVQDSTTAEIGLEELPPVREDVRAYMAESRSRNRELAAYRRKRLAKWDRVACGSPITGNPVRGGLRFSEATYIGGGSLSHALKAADLWRQGSYLPPNSLSSVVVLGQSFPSDWPENPVMEMEMNAAVLEVMDRLWRIQRLSRQLGSEAVEESQTLLAEIVQALGGLTTVLINGMNYPMMMGRRHVWLLFESNVVVPLRDLADSEQIQVGQRYSSPATASILWLKWAVFSWHFLHESAMQWDHCEGGCRMDEACDALLAVLFKADDVSFSVAIEQMREGMQGSRGTIHSQDVIEIWICLIHTLNQSARYHRLRGFWSCFNSQVDRVWAEAERAMVGDEDETTGESRTERARRYFDLMLELCPLHQYERSGSSSALSIVAPENWALVCWLLTHGLLDRRLAETVEGEQQCRDVTILCHRLVQVWKWGPGENAVVYIGQYLQYRQNRDMPTEDDCRFPEFLNTLIETATVDPELDCNIPKDDEPKPELMYYCDDGVHPTIPRLPRLSVDLSLVETVRPTDRVFEIFLKLVTLSLHQQVELIAQEPPAAVEPRDFVLSSHMDDPKLRMRESMAGLNRYERYKSCRKFITDILPETLLMLQEPNAIWDPISSVCNSCSSVLIVALMTSDSLRPSRVREIVAVLQAKASDDTSRQIVAHSLYYLGTIWQRQAALGKMAVSLSRQVDRILDFYYTQLEERLPSIEKEEQPPEEPTYRNRVAFRPLAPATGFAEMVLSLMVRLLKSEGRWEPGGTNYPNLAFLDKRLAPFIDPVRKIDSVLRSAAYILIEEFFEHRSLHKERITPTSEPAIAQASLLETSTSDDQLDRSAISAAVSTEDDDLSWLDPSALDDDFLRASLDEPKATLSKATLPKLVEPEPVTVVLPEDEEMLTSLKEWVFPTLSAMVMERRETLQRKYIMDNPDCEKFEALTRPALLAFFCPAPMQGDNKRIQPAQQVTSGTIQSTLKGTGKAPQAAPGDVDKKLEPAQPHIVVELSRVALQYLRDVIVDVSAVLQEKKLLTMDEIETLYQLNPYSPPVFQHWILQDKLSWTTRMAERCPGLLAENEYFFLSTWFATIGAPFDELKLQVQFSEAIVRHSSSLPCLPVGSMSPTAKVTLSVFIFDNIPWLATRPQRQPIDASLDPDGIQNLIEEIFEEEERLNEFKSSRYQVLARVLSNMGEHYATLGPFLENPGPVSKMRHATQEVRICYRQYLLLLFRSLAADYKRLEKERSEDEKSLHAEFISDIFGHALDKCKLIMQDDFGFQGYPVSFLTHLRAQCVASAKPQVPDESE